ncbi:hypothetical protein L195_g056288, partial [Trifolium pratense]
VRKLTWNQANAVSPNFWCLPPAFARDALMGYGPEELQAKYREPYLPSMQSLKLAPTN